MNINVNKRATAVRIKAVAAGLALLLAAPMVGASEAADNFDGQDFGRLVEQLLQGQSEKYFGFSKPLGESAPPTTGQYRTASQKAIDQVLLARGLTWSISPAKPPTLPT